jgi:iron(III) transport system permease protein
MSVAWRLKAPAATNVAALMVGLILVWLVIVPVAMLLLSAFKPTGLIQDPGYTLHNITETYASTSFWRLVGLTGVFAFGSGLLALTFGGALAWIVERTDVPGPRIIQALIVLPMATPPFMLAMSWIMLLSPRTGVLNQALMAVFGLQTAPFNIYSLSGMIFVEGLSLVPSAFLILGPAMRNIDPSLEESAQTSGAGTFMRVRRILLPLLWPSILGAAIYLFVVSCVVFDVPGTIGMPGRTFVLSTQIYSMLNDSPRGLPEYGKVSAIAVLLVAVLVVLAFVYQRTMRQGARFVTVTGKSFRPRRIRLGGARWFAVAFVTVYFLLAVAAPLGILIWSSLMPYLVDPSVAGAKLATLANHREFFENPFIVSATFNSLIIAVFASSAVVALSLVVGWIVTRTKAPGRRVLDTLAFIPLAIPGVLIALALIYVYLLFDSMSLYGTIWIIAVAHATVYLSFGSRSLNSVLLQLHPDLEDAARVSGAGWWRVMRRIVAPLAMPALAAVWLWVFSHSLRELTAALMLQGANNPTVPTLLYGYWSEGQAPKASAVGVWLMAATFVVILIWQSLRRSNIATRW